MWGSPSSQAASGGTHVILSRHRLSRGSGLVLELDVADSWSSLLLSFQGFLGKGERGERNIDMWLP